MVYYYLGRGNMPNSWYLGISENNCKKGAINPERAQDCARVTHPDILEVCFPINPIVISQAKKLTIKIPHSTSMYLKIPSQYLSQKLHKSSYSKATMDTDDLSNTISLI